MKAKWFLIFATAGLSARVFASGFGLYEASSKSCAMGGAVVGRACDASANFHNPATLTDLTNITVTIGLITEHPRGHIDVSDGSHATMDPGYFILPSFQLAIPLPYDFAFGFGVMPEVGLGSKYNDGWTLACNSRETTVTSFTLNPNLAYKVTDAWSVAAGLRFLYFDFEQRSNPWVVNRGVGDLRNRLKGDNDLEDWGWQVGTKYDILENLSVGLLYKSRTLVHVEGKTETSPRSIGPAGADTVPTVARSMDGPAETELLLPQSVSMGLNWQVTPRWEVAGMVSWTEWSTVDVLDFELNQIRKDINLNWEDTWRFGFGTNYRFAEDWTAICSYVYETDCTGDQLSTMLPGSKRHLVTIGLDWQINKNWSCCLSYGVIMMEGVESQAVGENNRTLHYEASEAYCHSAGLSVTYEW